MLLIEVVPVGESTPRRSARFRVELAQRPRRTIASLLSLLLLVGLGVVPLGPVPAQADPMVPAVSFSKTADGNVLAGEPIRYTLSATNSSVALFNVSFRDVLPPGVQYVGPTQPSSAGEPRIISVDVDVDGVTLTQQTLIWDNVSDLPIDASVAISFTANPSYAPQAQDAGTRVGDELTNTGQAAASAEPRFIARTDDTGRFVDDRVGVVSSTTDTATTQVSALEIAKAEPSPSGRLLRGLADQVTIYTLTVTNNDIATTTDVTVVDRLPAQLEFLGCEARTVPQEYAGARAPTLDILADCITPVSVDTIADGHVFTEVTWDLGDLGPGEVRTIRYRAAIPLLANTTGWGGGVPASATDGTGYLGHGATLTNNTGASTRELTANSQTVINVAVAAGSYTGPVTDEELRATSAQDDLTRVVADVRIQKSASPTTFAQGETVDYTLTIDVSQYVDASAIVVEDLLPDGMCPYVNASDTTNTTALPEECIDPTNAASPTNATFGSITANVDNGTFAIVFDDIDDIDANGTVDIVYTALARPNYPGVGAPTVAGDGFTNTATLTATTTPIVDGDGATPTQETGPELLADTAAATITTDAETLVKRVLPRAEDGSCPLDGSGYVDPYPPGAEGFRDGDRVCFWVQAGFSSGVDTRNPVLTDFLPPQVAYASSTVVTDPCGDGGCVIVTPTLGTGGALEDVVTFTLGQEEGGNRFVPPGAVFAVVIAGTVRDVPIGTEFDLVGNLVKLRSENTDGEVRPQRAEVELPISPVPNLAIDKTASEVNAGAPAGDPPPVVRQGDVVTYQVEVSNDPATESAASATVTTIDVWDVLPPGISCADVTGITDSGTCTDPASPSHPTVRPVEDRVRSVIVWTLDRTEEPLAPGQSLIVTYDVTIPSGVDTVAAASSTLTNDAYVRSFVSPNNLGDPAVFFPQQNIDDEVPESDWNAQELTDDAQLILPGPTLTKEVLASSQQTDTNNAVNRAVNGELVTYEVDVVLPASTTVYTAQLVDPLPPGLSLVDATLEFRPDAGVTTTASLPTGVTLTGSTVGWPAQYDVGPTDERFVLTLRARVAPDAAMGARTNTSTFSYRDAPGGTERTETDSASVTIIEPVPSLAKTNDVDGEAVGGQAVTYTLTTSNQSGRPPLHDGVVVDCLPAGLVFATFTAPTDGDGLLYSPAAVPDGCGASRTQLTWQVGTIEPASSILLTYTATVRDAPVGGGVETNTATLTGSTLNDGANDPATEGVRTATDSSSLTIEGATTTKAVTPTAATIGEQVAFTVTTTLPANVAFFNLSLIDALDTGLDSAVELRSISCAGVGCDDLPDDPATVTTLTTATNVGTTRVGWLLGDIGVSAEPRTVTLTYTTTVADLAGPAPVRSNVLTNTAWVAWDLTAGSPPGSAGYDFDVTSEDASATVTVLEPDLSITKTVEVPADRAAGRPEPTDTFTYSVTVTNSSADDVSAAYNLVVTDSVPTGIVVDVGSISDDGTYDADTRTITWTHPGASQLNGPIEPGASIATPMTYTATLASSSTLTAAPLVNTARIASYESLLEDGRVYVGPADLAAVTPAFPQLSLDKSLPDGGLAYVGEEVLWQLVITNAVGAGLATGLEVVDALPPNWSYVAGSAVVAGTPTSPTIATVGERQQLTWTAAELATAGGGQLASGSTLTITYRAVPTADALATPGVGSTVDHDNDATVTGRDRSDATGNADGDYLATGSASSRIDSADLRVTKTSGEAVAGAELIWSVSVGNHGPDPAVGPFVVTDTLPTGFAFVSASGNGWDCATPPVDLVLTCTRHDGSLAASASFPTIDVTVTIPATATSGTQLTNTAMVAARTYDPDLTNNRDDDTATITTQADLQIVKSLPGGMVAGQDATYQLVVTNNGPSVSRGPITVADAIPVGTTFVTATGDTWGCSEAASTLTCVRDDDLPVGQVAPAITLTVTVDSDRTADVVNTAIVSGTTPDATPTNDTANITTTPDTQADLGIEKALQGSFVAGEPVTYRLTVTNHGPSAAAGVVITDPVPASLTFSTATDVTGTWVCSQDAGLVTCSLTSPDPLPVDAHSVLDLTFDTEPGVASGTAVTNTATVSSDTTDPNPANDTSTDDSTIAGEADLVVTKTHATTVVAGEPATFTIETRNDGPSDAAAPVTVTDTLPDGMGFVSASAAGWSCVVDGQTVTCTLVDGGNQPIALPADTSAPEIELVVDVDPSAGPATLRNTVTVDSPTSDPQPGNNTSHDDVLVGTRAELSLTKTTSGADPVAAGDLTAFTLQVANAGPSTARDVSITDALPSGVAFDSATGGGWACTAPTALTVTCTRLELLPGAAPPITVAVRVLSGVASGTVLTNTATVSTSTEDLDPANDHDTSTVSIDTVADLELAKTGPTTAPAGGLVTFELRLTNAGPSDATAPVRLVDQLPPGLVFASAAGPWSCDAGPVTDDGQLVTCELGDGDTALVGGAQAPLLTLTAGVAAGALGDTLTNVATATSPTVDPDPDGATDDHEVQVVPPVSPPVPPPPPPPAAELEVTKTHQGPVAVGERFTFTVQVRNAGAGAADDVRMRDVVPEQLTVIAVSGDGWSCDRTGQQVTCDLGAPLAPETTAGPISIEVEATAAAYPSVTNTAVVTTTTPGPDEEDAGGSDSDTVTVPPLADLSLTKTSDGPFITGQRGSFRLEVTNLGPTADPGPITVVDRMPAGLTPLAASGPGWSCELAATVTCVRADGLDVGASSAVVIEVVVEPDAVGLLVNEATVISDTDDPDDPSDQAQDPVDVVQRAVLTATKEAVSERNGTLTWSITIGNLGPVATTDPIVVVDDLADPLTFRSSSGEGWSCEAVDQRVACTHTAPLGVGEETVLTLVTDVDAPVGTTIRNSIEVLSGGDELDVDGVEDIVVLDATTTADSEVTVGDLARTGLRLGWLVALGLALVALGVGIVSRRTRTSTDGSG